ncbi:sirohydrochlorin cobaltochelatase [Clostridium sp.]|uniref:sirohydrochlorin cobaltochelatase n=1 Tax=Clostridium sp. TaxID=1506 RepID=UPI00262B26A7|nr:sirohydrochlorin cobaltochelatase [Clostridium sp.]
MKKAILIVCFGTSFLEPLENSTGRLEEEIKEVLKGYEVFRSFTSEKIIRKIKNKHNIDIYKPNIVLEKLKKDGYKEVVIAPIYIMNGEEYRGVEDIFFEYKESFESIKIGTPLLFKNSLSDENILINKDHMNSKPYNNFINSIEKLISNNKNTLLIGHGSYNMYNSEYKTLQIEINKLGYNNTLVGVLEGDIGFSNVLERIKEKNIKEITIIPLMIFAGWHTKKDMILKDDSWKNKLEKEGIKVSFIEKGLLEYKEVRDIFINKIKEII